MQELPLEISELIENYTGLKENYRKYYTKYVINELITVSVKNKIKINSNKITVQLYNDWLESNINYKEKYEYLHFNIIKLSNLTKKQQLNIKKEQRKIRNTYVKYLDLLITKLAKNKDCVDLINEFEFEFDHEEINNIVYYNIEPETLTYHEYKETKITIQIINYILKQIIKKYS